MVRDVLELHRGGAAFIYIGHGDDAGAHSSEGFAHGLRQRFAELVDIERWGTTPLIWWCCFSAVWLNEIKRRDWFGFSDYIGYDARDGQGDWWDERLRRIFEVLLMVGEGSAKSGLIKEEMEALYDASLRDHFVEDRISYLNVVLARLHAEGAVIGASFGET